MDRRPLARTGRALMRLCVYLVGFATIVLAAMTGFEVVARKLFAFSLQGVDEIGGYLLAIISAFGFTFALIHRSHTRIDLFLARFPARLHPILNVASVVSLFGFAAFMAWRVLATLADTIEYQSISTTPLQLPLWIPQGIWALELLLFAIVAGVLAARATALLFTSPDTVMRDFSPLRLQEEIEEQIRAAGAGLEQDGR